jgi:hypothetical protein
MFKELLRDAPELCRQAPSRVRSAVDGVPVLPGVLDRAGELVAPGPSLAELAEGYARQGRIDERAPVRGRAEIEVDAPIAAVWAVLSDIAGWAGWSKGVHHVTGPKATAVGEPFVWWNSISRIQSRIAVLEPERELSWTGISFGARGVHRNTVRSVGAGRTVLMSEESLNGPLIGYLFPSSKLQAGLEIWVAEIAARASS